MNSLDTIIIIGLVSGVSFIFFGIGCFKNRRMKLEFERYGLPHRRILTGALQLVGGIGLITGMFISPILAFAASVGLSLLMFLGFGVRLKIKDGPIESTPALLFAVLNLYLAVEFFKLIP